MVFFKIKRKQISPEISPAPPQYASPTEPWIDSPRKLPATQEVEMDGIYPNQQLLRDENSSSPEPQMDPIHVKWGVAWGVPAMMLSLTVIGIGVAGAHHGYYTSLHGTPVGSFARQNWALRFGTAFSFLSISLLRTACIVAYKQYIWTLLKRKSYSITAIDRLFSLSADLTAFRSWELIRHADIAVSLALVCWFLPLAGITPPATLSVGHGFSNETVLTSMPNINWLSKNISDVMSYAAYPNYAALQMASLSAKSMRVLQATPPAPNVTFHRQFYGPTVQCAPANATQQPFLDAYTELLWNTTLTVGSRATFDSGKLKWKLDPNALSNDTSVETPYYGAPLMNVFSAFTPTLGGVAWSKPSEGDYDGEFNTSVRPDQYNNWWPGITEEVFLDSFTTWKNPKYYYYQGADIDGSFSEKAPAVPYVVPQTFIQGADQAIVCTLGNASFDVDFTFIDGTQTQAVYTISDFIPFWVPRTAFEILLYTDPVSNDTVPPETFRELNSYMGIFTAFTSLLNGNISTTLSNMVSMDRDGRSIEFDGNAVIFDYSSQTLQNGLSACQDFTNSSWNGDGAIGLGRYGPAIWQNSTSKTNLSSYTNVYDEKSTFRNITNELFKKPSWMCRNQTLLRGIEDLANNVTISMLSVSSFLTNNASNVEVHHFQSINVYVYNSRNLAISYCIAVFFTLIAVGIGFWSLHFNGVAHSTNFSAIIGTTRNPELNKYMNGHSLGVFGGSRGHSIGKGDVEYQAKLERGAKLRFGELVGGEGADMKREHNDGGASGMNSEIDETVASGATRHIGFGSQENVVMLRKGGRYV